MAGGSRYDGTALGPNGRGPIPHATIAVLTQPANTSTTPGSPLATIYTDATLTTTTANPFQADVLGNFHFYADATLGPFTIQVYGPQVQTPYVLADQGMPSIPGGRESITTKILDDSYNVLGYGAKADGVTDDTTAIQAAVNAAVAAGGGTVVFPTGKTCLTTAPINISGTLIRLRGSQSDNNNGASTIIKNATLGPIFQTTTIDAQLSMLNLDLQGNVTATGGVGATIDAVKLVGDAINGNDSTIRACTFSGLRRAVWTQGRNVAIIDNVFQTTQTPIYIDVATGGGANRDFVIRGNRFHQNGASATDADIYIADSAAFVFQISQNFHDYGLLGRFFYAPNSATQVHITDNLIYSARKTAIEFLDGTDVHIIGNTIIFGPVGTDTDVSGIVFRNFNLSEISGNLIDQAHRYGIISTGTGSVGLSIHDNVITNASFALANTYDAINFAGATASTSVKNNIIYNSVGTVRTGINIASGTNIEVAHNVVNPTSCGTTTYSVGTYAGSIQLGDLSLTSQSASGTKITLESTATNGRKYGIGSNFVVGNGEFSIFDFAASAERFRIIPSGITYVKRLGNAFATTLVAGDFALSAGWGNTATVTAVVGTDQAWTITVTANGTGIAANPTVTLTFHDGTWTNAPTAISKMVGGAGTITALTDAPTATTWVITFNGTPVATSTYIISGILIGR